MYVNCFGQQSFWPMKPTCSKKFWLVLVRRFDKTILSGHYYLVKRSITFFFTEEGTTLASYRLVTQPCHSFLPFHMKLQHDMSYNFCSSNFPIQNNENKYCCTPFLAIVQSTEVRLNGSSALRRLHTKYATTIKNIKEKAFIASKIIVSV